MIYHPKDKLFYATKLVDLVSPKNRDYPMWEASSLGSKEINDVSTDLDTHVWLGYVKGEEFYIRREDLAEEHMLFTYSGIEQVDFTFDQTMRPVAVFVSQGLPYIYSFRDTKFEITGLDTSINFPRLDLDSKKLTTLSDSDIILGYVNEGKLCYRMQRDRYTIEYVIANDPTKSMLWRIGQTVDGRFGFHWR